MTLPSWQKIQKRTSVHKKAQIPSTDVVPLHCESEERHLTTEETSSNDRPNVIYDSKE